MDPAVSVVIPAFDEEESLPPLLEELEAPLRSLGRAY
jgi:glycosyltransferase involved in cell wall biosynthesis